METTNMSDHFRIDSALVEFLTGRLGAPDCWPDHWNVKPPVIRARRTEQVTAVRARILTVAEHKGLADTALQ